MVRFGGIVTLNMLVVHIAYNLDKVLLGRFWGAGVVGIYGRAYQLISLPTELVNGAIGSIAISALSRLQNDRERLWSYFCKGYSLVLAVTIPIPIICALFADEIVLIMFGPKWTEAIPVFRLLAPAVLALAIINPTGWLLVALGKIERSLKIALVIAPLVIAGCVIGLPYGATGVAIGFSVSMVLWVVPHLLWCFSGTGFSFREVILVIRKPLVAGIVSALCALAARTLAGPTLSTFLSLALGCATFAIVYVCVLMFVMKQSVLYLDIIRALRAQPSGKTLVQP
jgi:PST family polysaccharide transporter